MSLLAKFKGGSSLTARLLRGGVWMGAANAGEQGLRFVRNMILARVLAPEAFGLMAIVLSVSSLFQVLTGMCIKESVIQNPRGAEKTFLNGVWCLAMGRALLLCLVAFVAAPWIGQFYEEADLSLLIRVAFLNVLFQGALSPGAYVAIKQMQYLRWILVQHGGGVVGVLTTIVLAFWIQGVWALVIGYVTESAARCLISYVVCPFRPSFDFHREDLQSLYRFARSMFGMPILMLIFTEGSTFVVGKLCNKQQLGLFALCYTLARVPGMFSGMLADLFLPSFTQMQKDPARLNQNLLKVTSVFTLIALPMLAFTYFFGDQILSLVYGPAYAAGGVLLFLLLANEILYTCNVPIATLYVALGHPAALRQFSLLRALLFLGIIYPLVSGFGLLGAAIAPLTAMIIAYGFQLNKLRTFTGLSVGRYLGVFGVGLLFSLPILLWIPAAKIFFQDNAPWLLLTLSLAGSLILYGLIGSVLWRFGSLRTWFWPFLQRRPAT